MNLTLDTSAALYCYSRSAAMEIQLVRLFKLRLQRKTQNIQFVIQITVTQDL